MKIAVIGGGGVRSPLLARSIAFKSKEIGIDEVVFMDNQKEQLDIYGTISKIASAKINPNLRFELTTSIEEAVKDADYIITTIRVGNDEMRIKDERTALAHGVIGQETTGAAGISFAMRSVTVLARYCEIIKKLSQPNVKVFNFTNPAGIVTQTLRDMGYDFCYGICDAPTSQIESVIRIGGYDKDRLSFECIGLNHFSFITSVKYDGQEVLDEILDSQEIHQHSDLKFMDQALMKRKRMLFNEYLYYYLYPNEAYRNISQSAKIRSEIIKEINDGMKEELQQIDITNDFERALKIYSKWYNKREASYMKNETGMAQDKEPFIFDVFDNTTNGYASIALNYITAVETKTKKDLVLCTTSPHQQDFSQDEVIEVSCTIDGKEVKPHQIQIEDDLIKEMVRRIKQYEKAASKALRSHRKSDFIDCLMLNPLVCSYVVAKDLTDAFFKINKDFYEEQ